MSNFSFKDRLMSFKYAYDGLKVLFRDEHNSWIHLAFAILSVALGFYFDISSLEWIAIVICIGSVFSAEILNTSIEHIANFIQPDIDLRIKDIKDLGAAAVVVVALSSLIVGSIIFLPKILMLYNS